MQKCPLMLNFMPSTATVAALALLRIITRTVRLSLFSLLATLEPVVRIGLSLVATAGLLICALYRLALPGSHFPLGSMLALSAGCSFLLVLYYLLLRALAP